METAVKRPQVIVSAIITRADGTVENLGIICETTKEETINKTYENILKPAIY